MELAVPDSDVEGLTPIDSREIPASYMRGVTLPVLLAYRYVSHPYTIRMGAMPHAAADVTVAVVESAHLSTIITEEGNMITDMACTLRNSRQQYLRLKLPERIWHAFVDNKPVMPLIDGEITKIPVARAAGSSASFVVRLRYSQERDSLGRVGSIRLESPFEGIDVMRLGWKLSLPDGYEVVRDLGNIRMLEDPRLLEADIKGLKPDMEVQVRLERDRSIQEQGGEQYEWNWQAQRKIQQDAGGKGRQVGIYTGSKPSQGNVFVFQSLILTGEEAAWVGGQYVKGSMAIPLKGVLAILVAALCGLAWRRLTWPPAGRVAVLAGAAVVLLGVRTLAEGAYRSYLTTVILSMLVVAAALALYTAGTWLREAWTRRRIARDAKAISREQAEPPAAQPAPE
ncbi:MAG: hypothetical protein QGH74_05725 [Candidatus Brocadiia bacterium]|nr:hypothetical protein [Candidatus Brocadiia bacterium]